MEGYDAQTREVSLAFPQRIAIELDRIGAPHRPHRPGSDGTTTPGTVTPPTTTVATTHVEPAHVEPAHVDPPPPPATTVETPPHRGLTSPFGHH